FITLVGLYIWLSIIS
ncbi:hypothetical protein V7159_22445, partial [Priestia megaterium]